MCFSALVAAQRVKWQSPDAAPLPPGLMQVTSRPWQPWLPFAAPCRTWQILACDVMAPYPGSPHDNQYQLVITNHFSKWGEVIPFRKLLCERMWERLLETFPRFGFTERLITDNALYFTRKVFADSCRALGIRHKKTTTYHPQSNIIETVNRNRRNLLVAITDT